MPVLPLLNPHRLRDDGLDADAMPVDFAAGHDGVLAGERMEPLDPEPTRRRVAERRSDPDRVELQLIRDEGIVTAPCRRALHVYAVLAEGHPDESADLLALRRPAKAERRDIHALEARPDRRALHLVSDAGTDVRTRAGDEDQPVVEMRH